MLTSSESKAKSPKPSRSNCRLICRADEKARIAKPSTTDPVAYDLYLRARQLDDLTNDPDAKGYLLQGISLLEEAVRRDPKFLRAYCLMCETHLDLYWGGADHTERRRELARIALQKAEEIQPDAGEVHAQKGLYAYHGFRDYDGALKELEKAKELLPNEARIYVTIGAIDRRSAPLAGSANEFQARRGIGPTQLPRADGSGLYVFRRAALYRSPTFL